jgi:D-alanyl-D-alanine carboxypeptidase (penicillin-binding protein 5/6)
LFHGLMIARVNRIIRDFTRTGPSGQVVQLIGVCAVLGIWALMRPSLAVAAIGGPPVLTDGEYPPLRLYPEQVEILTDLSRPPELSARAALMMDMDSGQVLYAQAANEPLPPASTLKVMTALLTLEHSALDEPVTVSTNAAATEGSRMGLVAGETLTVEDLLYGLLLPSGNDAAVALAEHVAGSETDFAALMNRRGQELGLTHSNFVNPYGWDDPAQAVSATDLITITREALRYPTFVQIVRTPNREVAGHSLVNTNELLGVYPDVDGIKTGTTDAAGENLIASVNHGGRRTIVVILGSQDRYTEARALLDYAAKGWRWSDLVLTGSALDWEEGPDGRPYRLKTEEPRSVFAPAWQWPLMQPERQISTTVPLTATAPIGSLRLRLGREILAETPLGIWSAP